jgi:UDP-glucose 4-epimerase
VNVLVVGAAGFIGSHLVDRLVAEGHSVDAIDDLSSGSLSNLADARSLGGDLRIHTLEADGEALLTLAGRRRPDAIVHLGIFPAGRHTPLDAGRAVHSLAAVLEAAATLGECKVVATVYADTLYGELSPREVPVKEGHSAVPSGVRGLISRSLIDLCSLYRSERNVEYTVLALGHVYGSRQRSDGGVVAAFRAAQRDPSQARLFGDGRTSRDFVYIDDTVDALAKALVKADGLCVNVGTGVATSIRDLWALVAGPDVDLPARVERFAGVTRSGLAVTRARIQLGWAPWTDLATGLRSF